MCYISEVLLVGKTDVWPNSALLSSVKFEPYFKLLFWFHILQLNYTLIALLIFTSSSSRQLFFAKDPLQIATGPSPMAGTQKSGTSWWAQWVTLSIKETRHFPQELVTLKEWSRRSMCKDDMVWKCLPVAALYPKWPKKIKKERNTEKKKKSNNSYIKTSYPSSCHDLRSLTVERAGKTWDFSGKVLEIHTLCKRHTSVLGSIIEGNAQEEIPRRFVQRATCQVSHLRLTKNNIM